MRMAKRIAVSLLAAAMALSMLTACGGGNPEQPADSNNGNSGTTEPAKPEPTPNPTPTPDPTPSEPAKPALPTTWADSRTNAYFTRLGVTAENVYEEYEGIIDGEQATIRCALKGKKLFWEGASTNPDGTVSHPGYIVDAQGNAYSLDYTNRTIQTNEAGSEDAVRINNAIREEILFFIPIPDALDVAKVSATETYQYGGKNYYAESIKIRASMSGNAYTGEWDYLFDGDELKYVVMPEGMGGITLKINQLKANPEDSLFVLPNWYSNQFESSRTSAWFKSKGVSKDRYAVQLSVESEYGEPKKIIATVDGTKAFAGQNRWYWDETVTLTDGNLILGDYNNYYSINYYSKSCYGPQTIETIQGDSIRAAGGYLLIPDASNTRYMTSGTAKEGDTTYYKESFYIKNSSGPYRYDYYFKDNDLKFIKVDSQESTIKIEKISSVPDQSYLKIPDGFEVIKPNA